MGRNAAGTFTRVHNWVTDKNNSVKITAARFDAENDEFASALTSSGEIVKLQTGSYHHLNVTETTAQNSISGTLAAGAITSYATGQPNWWIPGFNNTGAVTLTISGLAARSVQAAGAAMTSGMLLSSVPAFVVSDGSGFHCMNPQRAPINFVPATGLQADSVITAKIIDDAVTTAKIIDNSVTLAKLKHETVQGAIIHLTASGTPTYLAPGTSGQLLASGGASANVAWSTVATGATNGFAIAMSVAL
jgi:hypothetical protein